MFAKKSVHLGMIMMKVYFLKGKKRHAKRTDRKLIPVKEAAVMADWMQTAMERLIK